MFHDLGFRFYLLLTFAIAFFLSIFPVGLGVAGWFRPEFICLLSIFWVLYGIQRVGIGFVWLMGLILDIIEGGVWGAHAFAMMIVIYIVMLSYRRLVSYSLVQQMLWVLVLTGIHQVFYNWVQGIAGHSVPVSVILLPALMSAFCWPLLVVLIRRFGIRHLQE